MTQLISRQDQTVRKPKSRLSSRTAQPSHPARMPLANRAPTILQRALANPHTLAPDDILQLQRTVGNQAVQRLLNTQAKPAIQRDMTDGFAADGAFARQLSRSKGNGTPLPKQTRTSFESSFGANFDHVRIHTDASAHQLSHSIQAKAFTHGNDIHFSKGAYNPTSSQGKHLLAHELTHTIQQGGSQQSGGGVAQGVQRKYQVGAANDQYEKEADRIANAVTQARPAASLQLQRLQRAARAKGASPMPIQRKLAYTASDLTGGNALSDKLYAAAGQKETYIILKQLLNRYHQSNDADEQLRILNQMNVVAQTWLGKHDAMNTGQGSKASRFMKDAKTLALGESNKSKKSYSLHFLVGAIDQELSNARQAAAKKYLDPIASVDDSAHDAYLKNMDAGNMKYLTEKGINSHQRMKQWLKDDDDRGANPNATRAAPAASQELSREHALQAKQARALMQQHKLTQAEATAIMIYSAEDFRYMNPTIANNMGWLHSQLPRTTFADQQIKSEIITGNPDKRPDKNNKYGGVNFSQVKAATGDEQARFHQHAAGAKAEGMIHSRMALSGMKKLSDWQGITYRGSVLTPAEFKQQYPAHGNAVMQAFTSTSTSAVNPESFIHENEEAGKVNILLELHLTHGKDIAAFSYSRSEEEILLMPGAVFKVRSISPFTTPMWKVSAQKVVLEQVS